MKSPAFRFYPSDFWGSPDVQVMELHEVGAYVALLSVAWASERPGYLPDDDERLRRWARMTREQWVQSRDVLLSKFPVVEGGLRMNPRLLHEAQKQELFSASQSDKANRRWKGHKTSAIAPEDAGAMPGDMPGHAPEDAGAMPSVSVSEVSTKTKDISPSAPSLVDSKPRQMRFAEEEVESIWKMWPNKGGKQDGLSAIRKALAHLGSTGVADPSRELRARVKTWLAWRERTEAKGEFVPSVCYAQKWFNKRRYMDEDAQPPAETMLLIDGELKSQAECEAEGWIPVRGDAA